ILLLQPNLSLLPYGLNLPPLPFAPADQIANEKTLQDWNQRHRENKKESGEHRQVKQEAERWIDLAKGFLKPRQRVWAHCVIKLLNERVNDRYVVLPAEERSDRD